VAELSAEATLLLSPLNFAVADVAATSLDGCKTLADAGTWSVDEPDAIAAGPRRHVAAAVWTLLTPPNPLRYL